MLGNGRLPQQLLLLLQHPQILKVGRLVDADLKYLEAACQSPVPFVGGLDLAKYAKDQHVIQSISHCSLSDLCALVLGKCLQKNVPERVSNAWENDHLTDQQIHYAASDVWASLCIYKQLSALNVPQPLLPDIQPGTLVLVYSPDSTVVVAHGRILNRLHDKVFDTINVTPSRTVVDIFEVYVPGAIITAHHKRSLDSFGPVPFTVVCLQNQLRSFSTLSNLPLTAPTPQAAPGGPPKILHQNLTLLENDNQQSQIIESWISTNDDELQDLLLESSDANSNPLDPNASSPVHPPETDNSSAEEGNHAVLPSSPCSWDTIIHSRVLKDPFHVFNMLRLPAQHGVHIDFEQALRDAIFIPDDADQKRIDLWARRQNPPQTFDQIQSS